MTPGRRKFKVKDTTLRDGEQMEGVEYSPQEKLFLATKIIEAGVDSCEVASAKVGNGELKAAQDIAQWAEKEGISRKIEVLSFLDDASMEWVSESGVKTVNLLTKGSREHCESQLRKTPEEHLENIKKYTETLTKKGIWVNVYLEAWSEGMHESRTKGFLEQWSKRSNHKTLNKEDYVFLMLKGLNKLQVRELILCDTMGVLNPFETYDYVSTVSNLLPKARLVIHPHDDYQLGVSDVVAGVKAGAYAIQGTINGMGERAGNANIFSAATAAKDLLYMDHNVDENRFTELSELVERISGVRTPPNLPIVGKKVYFDTAGIHAHGKKRGLYQNKLSADRFTEGRTRKGKKAALGKLAGKASLEDALAELGYHLDEEARTQVYNKFKELSGQGKPLTHSDLIYIVADALGRPSELKMRVIDVISPFTMSPKKYAKTIIMYEDKLEEADSTGDGQYNAFMKATRKILKKKGVELPVLHDYTVHIPPGGTSAALTIVEIVWTWGKGKDKSYLTTKGTHTDQLQAAIEATEKMINHYLKMEYNGKNTE